ncbi:MAG: transposase [Gammaproteobacteria bacterium]|nr:transposase [Gammaproteobacteria bacterium]
MVNHKKEVLVFLYDFAWPCDHNLTEHDVRMVKVKQQISGCFRSDQGAKTFSSHPGYIFTVRKQGHNVFSALCDTFDDAALIPFEEKANTCEVRLSYSPFLSDSILIIARFVALWPLRALLLSPAKARSSTQCKLFSIAQCVRAAYSSFLGFSLLRLLRK